MLLNKYHYYRENNINGNDFPFTLSIFEESFSLQFTQAVTIFVGENGSGKSTFIESLAQAANMIQLSQAFDDFGDYRMYEPLLKCIKLEWSLKERKGLFFRADAFDSFIRQVNEQQAFAKQELARIEAVDPLSLERLPYLRTLGDLEQLYPIPMRELSHGQSFIELFKARLRPHSLYVLDEPETPLTPQNQLSLLVLIDDMIKQGSQFIIATHSPVIMAYPQAQLLEIRGNKIEEVEYEEIEHVRFMEQFIKSPQSYMRHLFRD